MKRIEGLLKEFTSGADRVENSLSSMLELVSGGRVPPKSDIQILEQDIEGLQRAFDSIQSLAFEVVTEENMPAADAAVSDYAEAIKCAEAVRMKEQLAEIEKRLHRFISVKSFVVAFEEALKPYQAAAQDLLSQIDIWTAYLFSVLKYTILICFLPMNNLWDFQEGVSSFSLYVPTSYI